MTYDKSTGEVTIHDPKDKEVKRKYIDNVDDVLNHKQELYKELGLDKDGFPKEQGAENMGADELTEKFKT